MVLISCLTAVYGLIMPTLVTSARSLQQQRKLATTPDLNTASSFESIFRRLSFGYENMPLGTGTDNNNRSHTINLEKASNIKSYFEKPYALCQPEKTRARGCEPLFGNDDGVLKPIQVSLPCVTSGSCPYARFRCSKGHEWKAVVGSPVCFHCPICKTQRRIYGKRRASSSSEQVLNSLQAYARSRGGQLEGITEIISSAPPAGTSCASSSSSSSSSSSVAAAVEATVENQLHPEQEVKEQQQQQQQIPLKSVATTETGRKYGRSSQATFRCSKGHVWRCRVGNILSNKTWCPHCNKESKAITSDELSATARVFGGKFLGFVEDALNNEEFDNIASTLHDNNPLLLQLPAVADRITNVTDQQQHQQQQEHQEYLPQQQQLEQQGQQFLPQQQQSSSSHYSIEKKKLPPMTRRLALWECEEGHQFYQRAGNIRRPPGGKRGCSWCPTCKLDGKKFVWNNPEP